MKAWRHTLRLRLALWYALSIAFVLAASGVMLYEVVRYQLVRHHDRDLTASAAAVTRILSQRPEGEKLDASQRNELDAIRHVVLVAEKQAGGQVVYASPGSSDFNHLVEGSGEPLRLGEGRFETFSGDGEPLRVYSEARRVDPENRELVVYVAHGLGDMTATLASLRLGLLLMAPIATLLSALGGYWLAGRALAPVDAVTRMAREIGATSLSRRLEPPRASDEIGRLVETFNEMIGRLESSFEAMRRFTADASHELRGPLATMRSAIDVCLSRPRSPAEYREALASVADDVARLHAITEDLLLLARADGGHIQLDWQSVRLDVIAAEVSESFLAIAAERGVCLGVECAETVVVDGDERWLRQLVFNLLDNAVKFSAGAGTTSREAAVSVGVTRDVRSATLRIADSGPGIPDRALPRLFERFFRADDARPYCGREGFGLGLAIAAWVAEAHGGRIKAANRRGGGSVFSVSLPLAGARP